MRVLITGTEHSGQEDVAEQVEALGHIPVVKTMPMGEKWLALDKMQSTVRAVVVIGDRTDVMQAMIDAGSAEDVEHAGARFDQAVETLEGQLPASETVRWSSDDLEGFLGAEAPEATVEAEASPEEPDEAPVEDDTISDLE